MKIKHLLVGLAGLLGAAANASATIADFGSYTVEVSDGPNNSLGPIDFSFTSSGNVVGFGWNLRTEFSAPSNSVFPTGAIYSLPSFAVTANAGYTLSGPVTSFIGNLVYNEFGGSTTSASAGGMVSFDGGAGTAVSSALTKTRTNSMPNFFFEGGYYSGTAETAITNFVTFSVTDAWLQLDIHPGQGFASIIAQPQNELKFSFVATPVPVPAALGLLASALGAMSTRIRRRS